ncbi:efflux RND transporter permease subunit, partial [bacterium]|nr:efflux RND transporter permease subunit [bacterium]
VMSLGGLALGVGMLVDNAIVVLEAIHRRREEAKGDVDRRKLTVKGASEVGSAVIASTLTTVAVFVPIVFVVVGVAGQIFRDQALTVTFSLFVSLIVALTFTPMAMAWGARDGGADQGGERLAFRRRLFAWTRFAGETRNFWWYPRAIMLGFVLFLPVLLVTLGGRGGGGVGGRGGGAMGPRPPGFGIVWPRRVRSYPPLLGGAWVRRGLVMVLVVLLAAGAVLLFPTLGNELIPPLTQGEFTLGLELPEGTPLSRTNTRVAAIETELASVDGIVLTASDVGVSREGNTSAQRRKENRAEIHVKLDSATKEREEQVLEGVRAILAKYPEVTQKLRRQSLFSFNAPVEVDVYGYNLDDLQATVSLVAKEMADIDGLRDVKQGMVPGSPEVRVSFDRDKLNRYNLTLSDVSETVRGKVRGTVASRIRERERHIDIRVLNEDEQRSTLQAVQDLIIAERAGIPITLGAVASTEVVRGPSEIHRLGRKRVAIVTANLAGRDLGSVSEELAVRLRKLTLPANISVSLGGQNEEMQKSFRSLQMAILLAVFLVYLVMAAQFESFVYPFIIMFTVPLALVGAVYGLKLTGTAVSVIAVIGAIMLAGIVVNNGIVLVDRINKLRRRLGLYESVLQAGQERFRPIVMTTATTVLGLLPMALGLGEGAELRTPLAVTVISGLLFATLLTLVVVPVVYTLITPNAEAPARARRRAQSGAQPFAKPARGES